MKRLALMFMLMLIAAPLSGCVVYPAHPVHPYAGALWVPGHYNAAGFWVRGHYA